MSKISTTYSFVAVVINFLVQTNPTALMPMTTSPSLDYIADAAANTIIWSNANIAAAVAQKLKDQPLRIAFPSFWPNSMFNYPLATSVQISLGSNQITSIPSGMFKYPLATSVAIRLYHNTITSLPSNAFISNAKSSPIPRYSWNSLYLDNNKITIIAPGAIQGNYSEIRLGNNKLTNFQSKVFQSTVNGMVGNSYNYISIYGNPIDCSANLCDLAWLIRDNRQLLPYVQGGTCSNGTVFDKLSANKCNIATTTLPPKSTTRGSTTRKTTAKTTTRPPISSTTTKGKPTTRGPGGLTTRKTTTTRL